MNRKALTLLTIAALLASMASLNVAVPARAQSQRGLKVAGQPLASTEDSAARGWLKPYPATQTKSSESPLERFFNSAKKRFAQLLPKPEAHEEEETSDPISLDVDAKPSAELYVAMGRLAEQHRRYAEAEQRYKQALEVNPNHLQALLALARLKDMQRNWAEAEHYYKTAQQAHPNEACVYNDYALSLARRGRFEQALAMLTKAVQLEPKRWLYRNNLAMLLVQLGKTDEAVQQLRAVTDEAIASYNVGYMLQLVGRVEEAKRYFAAALEHDPKLEPARKWLEKLSEQDAQLPQLVLQPKLQDEATGPTRSVNSTKGASETVGPKPTNSATATRQSAAAMAPLPPPTASVGPVSRSDPNSDSKQITAQQHGPLTRAASKQAPLPPRIESLYKSGKPVRRVQPLPPVLYGGQSILR